jgi:hypothetical protein
MLASSPSMKLESDFLRQGNPSPIQPHPIPLYGYELIELPKVSVADRVTFVRQRIGAR